MVVNSVSGLVRACWGFFLLRSVGVFVNGVVRVYHICSIVSTHTSQNMDLGTCLYSQLLFTTGAFRFLLMEFDLLPKL